MHSRDVTLAFQSAASWWLGPERRVFNGIQHTRRCDVVVIYRPKKRFASSLQVRLVAFDYSCRRFEVAQWLACWAHNPKVPGSKPGFEIFCIYRLQFSFADARSPDAPKPAHSAEFALALAQACMLDSGAAARYEIHVLCGTRLVGHSEEPASRDGWQICLSRGRHLHRRSLPRRHWHAVSARHDHPKPPAPCRTGKPRIGHVVFRSLGYWQHKRCVY